VDIFATAHAVEQAIEQGKDEAQVVVVTEKPKRSRSDLEGLRFEEVLGYFETKYARDLAHEARTFNLRLAASKLDGYVLLPGEVFDFNAVVGPRTEANGYKVAPVIAQGELVDGIGGGTCQIAGTLHGASFFAGLEILERKPHTRPSFYIKMGMDAAVAYPAITLKIKNTLPFAISFHETVKEGVVRAEILGPRRSRDVTFFRRIEEATPFREKNVDDPSVPKGERVLSQRGVPGFRVMRFRIVRVGGFAVREKVGDQYPSVTQIW
jgi:vancomycin resistance protein YoaR